ncbi:MAG: redoxin domain-containing protein [Planctomycetota bacterium]|nr:redoxin domain-containing protein [Planctomycetota bacterium]
MMNASRRLLTLFALALFTVGALAVAVPQSTAPAKSEKAKVGKPAPQFTLKDTTGTSHSLSDFRGKIVVMQWINPDCPYCRRVVSKGVVEQTLEELKAIDEDIVYLAVNSTHYMDADDTAKYLKKHELDVPGLIDSDGTVGRLYDARTTPHMFVIDRKGVLRYSGAIDDDVRGTRGDEATNYVVKAVGLIDDGKQVSPDTTRPYGCSVKYAKK